MQVTLIAYTQLNGGFVDEKLGYTKAEDYPPTPADTLAEFTGRSCYQSWDKPNEATRKNPDYLANIVRQGHFSVLEHASASFYIEGVSRSLTHELVRHRHFSYSQESQRFVNAKNAEMVIPPALRGLVDEQLTGWGEDVLSSYERIVSLLADKGVTGKPAREAARAILPNMTATRITVTGNHRAWRDFLHKRWSTHADAEIRELAGELLAHLRKIAPNTYADIPTEPLS